eukprot:c18044_g1_i6.p1 GENE.c18044_g1_i6~~c18044_g1_i6.p1  ORF type:complete len:194 (-),score=12.79 c18044_g1_i6:25-606(-)
MMRLFHTSTSSIARALADASVTWKTVLPIPDTWNNHVRNKQGRSVAGTPAKLTVTTQGKRTTLIAAIGQTGIVHYKILPHQDEGTKAIDFQHFLLQLAQKLPRKSVIFLDNCKIHHSKELEQTWYILRQTYDIEKNYLPPYSPFLNPIELLQSFPPEKCKEFEKHSKSFYPMALSAVPFLGTPLAPKIETQNN